MDTTYAAVITDTATGDFTVVPEGYELDSVFEWVEDSALWATATLEDETLVDRALEALGRVTSFTREDVTEVYAPLGLRIRLTYADSIAHEALSRAVDASDVRGGLYVYQTELRLSMTGDTIARIGVDPDSCGWVLDGELVPFGDDDAMVDEVEDIWHSQYEPHQEDLLRKVVDTAVLRATDYGPCRFEEEQTEEVGNCTRQEIYLRPGEDGDTFIGPFVVDVCLADDDICLSGPDLGTTVHDADTASDVLAQALCDAIDAAQ